MRYRILVFGCLTLLTVGHVTRAQTVDLEKVDRKLRHQIEKRAPGWSYRRVEPMLGSTRVVIQVWSMQNRSVRIVVSERESVAEAKASMRNFPRNARQVEPFSDVGDEGYLWGYDKRQIHFRKGNIIIDVEAGADVNLDSDAASLTFAQRHAREKSEVTRLTRAFAKHLVDALDAP